MERHRGGSYLATGDTDIAAVGALLSDPGRCRILLALDDGRALPASRLAAEAGVSPATASSHLGKLAAGGLLTVEAHGRHRYYRLSGPAVGDMLETLQQLAPGVAVRSLRQGNKARALRRARTCYDHVAGRLGVDLMSALIENGYLSGGDGALDPARVRHDPPVGHGRDFEYLVTEAGASFLAGFGVRTPEFRRQIRYCVDWSEQRHHLSGGLGRALLDRLVDLDWIRRSEASRAVDITEAGRQGLRQSFGIDLDEP